MNDMIGELYLAELEAEALTKVPDKELEATFSLKAGEKLLMSGTKKGTVSSSINHMVRHRGQLTVYLRLNDIPVRTTSF